MAARKTTKKTATQAATATAAKNTVPANPAMVVWPTDVHGSATAVKKAIMQAASRVGSSEDKAALLLEVMSIGAAHIEAKLADNKQAGEKAREHFLARQEARSARELTNASDQYKGNVA